MKKTVSNVLKHLVCISLCIVVILPFYMVFINSLKPKAEAARISLHFRQSGILKHIWK